MRSLSLLLALITLCSILSGCGLERSTTSNTGAAQPATSKGEIKLAWIPPSTRADGTYLPLDSLAGYRIYIGTSSDTLHEIVDLNDREINDYTVKDLSSGSYYFSITAYDSEGLESNRSQVILLSVG